MPGKLMLERLASCNLGLFFCGYFWFLLVVVDLPPIDSCNESLTGSK